MLKYINAVVVTDEVPDEITLNINITNCPVHCPECHAQDLWEDVGTDLTAEAVLKLIEENPGITCVLFMGGDAEPTYVWELGKLVKDSTQLKVGWFSGRTQFPPEEIAQYFNYIKIGPYDRNRGGLRCVLTNQRLYKLENTRFKDITYRYWE